jgi:peptidoglycan/xylan/chitin deacetylase (PgdA/CDA1 family)
MKSIAERAVHAAGAMHFVRARRRGQCRILMYHRFHGTPAEVRAKLARQCEHLRRYYSPVSLSEIAEALRTGAPLPRNGLAITVDDGYRDLQLAFPIFRSFGFNVTAYVVSEFAEGRMWLWPDRVKHAFRNTALREAEIALGPGQVRRFSMASSGDLEQAMIRLPNAERLRVLDSLPERLGVDIPADAPLGCEALTWPELRAMAAEGLEIGAHTRTHPILSSVESPEEIMNEIGGSKRRIEEALGLKVRHFCYPNGRREDYNAAAIGSVRAAGYETAVTTQGGLVKMGADPLQLNRLGVDPEQPELYFERCAAGWGTPS